MIVRTALTRSLCLSSFPADPILVVPLRMQTLQSLLKILPVYLGGNQEVVCRDSQPLMICCSAAEAQYNKGRIQTITPGVNGKHHRQASTNAGLLFRDLYKCMRRNQRHSEATQMTISAGLITTLCAIMSQQFYFKGWISE